MFFLPSPLLIQLCILSLSLKSKQANKQKPQGTQMKITRKTKIKQINPMKQTKKKHPKINTNRQKTSKTKECHNTEKWKKFTKTAFLHWPTAPGCDTCPELWLLYLVKLCWKKSVFPLQKVVDSFLVRGRTLCPFPSLNTGILSGLNLFGYWECCYSLCEFIYRSVLLYLEDMVSLKSSMTHP